MEKAYELKALGLKIMEEAKKDGLTIAEEAAEKLAKAAYIGTKNWFQESAALSENKVDDFISPFFSMADGLVLPQIEAVIDFDGDGK
jgi:hypothetical protein